MSFSEKHNFENGEENRDGENYNFSANYGAEGLDVSPRIEFIRRRQIKNFIATLFLSQGVPMMLAGDEFRRTQRGNNNAWCQDNEISWVNWSLLEKNIEIYRFTKNMIHFRSTRPALRRKTFFTGIAEEGAAHPDISWHGVRPFEPDWSAESHLVACLMYGKTSGDTIDLFMAFNADTSHARIELPPAPCGRPWKCKIDTSKPFPRDFYPDGEEKTMPDTTLYIPRMTTIVLIA